MGVATTTWDEWRAKQMARTRDPSTSHAAAAWMVDSGQLGHDQALAMRYILAHPEGCIAHELRRGTKDGIWKRLVELERKGLIRYEGERRNPDSGRMERVIYPV